MILILLMFGGCMSDQPQTYAEMEAYVSGPVQAGQVHLSGDAAMTPAAAQAALAALTGGAKPDTTVCSPTHPVSCCSDTPTCVCCCFANGVCGCMCGEGPPVITP